MNLLNGYNKSLEKKCHYRKIPSSCGLYIRCHHRNEKYPESLILNGRRWLVHFLPILTMFYWNYSIVWCRKSIKLVENRKTIINHIFLVGEDGCWNIGCRLPVDVHTTECSLRAVTSRQTVCAKAIIIIISLS